MNVTLANKLEVLQSKLEIIASNYASRSDKLTTLFELNEYDVITMFQKNEKDAVIYAQGGIALINMIKRLDNVTKHTIAFLKDQIDSKFANTLMMLDPVSTTYMKLPPPNEKDVVFGSVDLLTYYLGVKNTLVHISPCIV